jgi:hypothetical protein
MEIKGKVHCFFEQSGTFKNEFIKLGIPAEDYDIQNNFGETDHVIDLFAEIENGYAGQQSVFDGISKDDLIIAFFPCIYFEAIQALDFSCQRYGTTHLPLYTRIDRAIKRTKERTKFHCLLYKLTAICDKRGFRLIVENPATAPHYLITGQNFPPPAVIDNDRTRRGDFFKKPTAYWFFGATPTFGESFQSPLTRKIITNCKRSKKAGLCSEERSMISPDYARNFICDFILGRKQLELDKQQTFDFYKQ